VLGEEIDGKICDVSATKENQSKLIHWKWRRRNG